MLHAQLSDTNHHSGIDVILQFEHQLAHHPGLHLHRCIVDLPLLWVNQWLAV